MLSTKKIANVKTTQRELTKANRIAKGIRKVLDNIIPNRRDKTMHARLSSAVLEWLKSPDLSKYSPALSEFAFENDAIPIQEIWKVPIQFVNRFNGYIAVKIPEIIALEKVVPPPGTKDFLFFLTLGVCDVITGKKICSTNMTGIYQYKNRVREERIEHMKATRCRGNLTVAAISLIYYGYEKEDETTEYKRLGESSGMVAAIYRT